MASNLYSRFKKESINPCGWCSLFPFVRDSKPERAPSVKQNSLNNCFVTRWCADGYRKAKPLGRQARNTHKRILPFGRAKKSTSFTQLVIRISLREAVSWSRTDSLGCPSFPFIPLVQLGVQSDYQHIGNKYRFAVRLFSPTFLYAHG